MGIKYIGLAKRRDSDEVPLTKEQDRTAAIMGIHNMAIAVPQIIAALGCAGLFRIMEALEVENGTAWVMNGAGCAAIIAAWLRRDLRR